MQNKKMISFQSQLSIVICGQLFHVIHCHLLRIGLLQLNDNKMT